MTLDLVLFRDESPEISDVTTDPGVIVVVIVVSTAGFVLVLVSTNLFQSLSHIDWGHFVAVFIGRQTWLN